MEYYSANEYDCSSEDEDVSTLDLSYSGFDSEQMRKKLDELRESGNDVTTVLLYQNSMDAVPGVIGRFGRLKYLDISSNGLSRLPPEIGLCPLTTLIAKNNRLSDKSLPPVFTDLTDLKELNLSGNDFANFPPEILNLKSIRYLYMGGNNLSKIPKEISKLQR